MNNATKTGVYAVKLTSENSVQKHERHIEKTNNSLNSALEFISTTLESINKTDTCFQSEDLQGIYDYMQSSIEEFSSDNSSKSKFISAFMFSSIKHENFEAFRLLHEEFEGKLCLPHLRLADDSGLRNFKEYIYGQGVRIPSGKTGLISIPAKTTFSTYSPVLPGYDAEAGVLNVSELPPINVVL
jgi:hypothetical protein